MMEKINNLAPEHIRVIQPYQPGKPISELARELGLNENNIIKLASNENPLGTSPLALEAMINALNSVARYPDGNGFELKEALSQRYEINSDQIILGNGSNDVLDLVSRTFLKASDDVIFSQHAFAVYPLVVQTVGATGITVPAKNYAHDLSAMHKAITPATRMVFIANPNNPTGTLSDATELLGFIEQVPKNIIVVLDEAYVEYLPENRRTNSFKWLDKHPNLVITRTFSKAYGLAGIRVGFGVAHYDIANLINRVRQPFNVNEIALAAARAALKDTEFVNRAYALNCAGMLQITKGLDQLGIEYIPSFGNFLSFEIKGDKKNATTVYQNLLKQGVIVRPLGNYEMPRHLRVTVGLESENQKFLKSLEYVIGELM